MNSETFPVPSLKNNWGGDSCFLPYYNYCCLKDEFRHVETYSNFNLVQEGRSIFCILRETSCKQKKTVYKLGNPSPQEITDISTLHVNCDYCCATKIAIHFRQLIILVISYPVVEINTINLPIP